MSVDDGDRSVRELPRALGAVVGFSSLLALAGCTSDEELEQVDPGVTDDTDGRETRPDDDDGDGDDISGEPDVENGTVDDDISGEPDDENGTVDDDIPGEPDDEKGTDDDSCPDDRITELKIRRDTLETELENLRMDFQFELTSYRAMKTYEEQWTEGFLDSEVEKAGSLGESVRDAICIVKVMDGDLELGHGTGWFIEKDLIVTNSHNVHEAGYLRQLRITTIDGSDIDDVTVLGYFEYDSPDVAVIRTDGYTHDTSLSVGPVDSLEEDDRLVQVGHPGSVGYWVISMGRLVTVSNVAAHVPGGESIDHTTLSATVPGVQGVSGSPVFSLDGAVIGMTHAGEPVFERSPGEPAPIAPSYVYDIPLSPIMTSTHVGVDIVPKLVEEWR